MPDINIFIILSTFIILLCVILLAITLSYFRNSARLKRLEEEKDQLYKETREEEDKILQKTQSDYQEIVSSAQSKAKSIIDEAARINSDVSASMNQAVQGLFRNENELIAKKSQDFVAEYEKQLLQLNTDSINMFKSVSKDVLDSISNHFSELKKIMEEQTINSKKIADEKIKTEYEALEKELVEYKKKGLEKIDHNIYQILLNISKIAFGRGLSIEEHEKLIAEALEEAANTR